MQSNPYGGWPPPQPLAYPSLEDSEHESAHYPAPSIESQPYAATYPAPSPWGAAAGLAAPYGYRPEAPAPDSFYSPYPNLGPSPFGYGTPEPSLYALPPPVQYPALPDNPAPAQVSQANPFARPLAPGLLDDLTAANLADEPGGIAQDLAATLFAVGLVANSPNASSLAGSGFAMGGSFIPTIEDRIRLLGPQSHAPDSPWWVESRKKIGFSASLAVGGGMAMLGGGVQVTAVDTKESVYCSLVSPSEARKLIPTSSKGTFKQLLGHMKNSPSPVRWPDIRDINSFKVNDALSSRTYRRGALGIVVSTMLQNASAYKSLTGTFERIVWKPSQDTLQICDSVEKIDEIGASLGFSVAEKAEITHSTTRATRIVMQFDLRYPEAYAAASEALRNHTLPLSAAPADSPNLVIRFSQGLAPGVQLLSVEPVEQTIQHAAFAALEPLSNLVGVSGLGWSHDTMVDKRRPTAAAGSMTLETTAVRNTRGMLWLGKKGEVVYVNAQYGRPTGASHDIFVGLEMGMIYMLSNVYGGNRDGLINKLNRAFAVDLPHFPKIASHEGYVLSVQRKISKEELQALSRVTPNFLQANVPNLADHHGLLKIVQALQQAGVQAQNPTIHALPAAQEGGYAPMLLLDAAAHEVATTEANAAGPDDLAIAQSRAMLGEVTNIETLGVLCQLLGDNDQSLQLNVRNVACESPLNRVAKFKLEFYDDAGKPLPLRGNANPQSIIRRFHQAQKITKLIDQGLEALQADVLGQVFAPQQAEKTAQALGQALLDVDAAVDLEAMVDRDCLCLVRQEAIYQVLPPADKARALFLYAQRGTVPVPADEKQRVLKAIAKETERLQALPVPASQGYIMEARLRNLAQAEQSLWPVPTSEKAHSLGTLDLPWAAAEHQARLQATLTGDPLNPLHLYDVHFVVQDNQSMTNADNANVRRALGKLVPFLQAYDPDGLELTFLNEHLSHPLAVTPRPRVLTNAWDVDSLQWNQAGERAMVGNVMEGLVTDWMHSLQQGIWRKPQAFIVITADGMADKDVFAKCLKQAKYSFADAFADQICVGMLPIRANAAGNSIATWLDDKSEIKDMVEANIDTHLPLDQRVYPLLQGMVDKRIDKQNSTHNRAEAFKAAFKHFAGMKLSTHTD